MPLMELEEFHRDFFQDVIMMAEADGSYAEDEFFEQFCEHLIDAGELETADRVLHHRTGIRVDGYGGDPVSSQGFLSLIISDFSQSADVQKFNASDMDAHFKRLTTFLEKSLDSKFRNALEESDPAFGLADLIATRWPTISKVRLFLISNRLLSARVDGREAGELQGVPITYSVWDLERLRRYATSGTAREDIEIDLERDFGGPMALLPAHLDDADYEAYLIVVPGAQLAAIYDRWGARLLEQNVRVFLQARGNVNKGIRNTIENDPTMFFAYNNGVTATAEAVQTRTEGGRLLLTGLRNFQIVNGGQTTASIHAASRRKADLSKIFVQMKLSIVEPERAIDVVPKISEFANSQNKVNAADFFANHPFHVRMEGFSRRVYAPSPDGSFRQTKWFYERARGQYQDSRGLLSDALRKKFDLEYPKAQLFSKTDLAKFINPWRGLPHIVSAGSQKNFARFAYDIGREWTKAPDAFNETYFRHAISKAIVFRETESLVSGQSWYQGGGLRSRVVPYAIAKLAHDAEKHGRFVDFEAVWRVQAVSEDLKAVLVVAAEAVHGVIAGGGAANPLEWAKNQACWSRTQALKIDWPANWLELLITADEQRETRKSGAKDQKMLNGIEAQSIAVNAGAGFWSEVLAWGMRRRLLSPTEIGVLEVAAAMPAKIPTERQSMKIIEALRKLQTEGCTLGQGML
jgi:hypothetical protein